MGPTPVVPTNMLSKRLKQYVTKKEEDVLVTNTHREAVGDENMSLKRQRCKRFKKVWKNGPVSQDYIKNQFLEEQ